MKVSGRGEYDHSGTITVLEDLAKLEIKKPTLRYLRGEELITHLGLEYYN
jgi:hypothetical protein